ncbi:hypothetical protein ACROYT_G014484 [Oculina patagonica]
MSSTNSKKNKRGARGSTEEEPTASKRLNMSLADNNKSEEEVMEATTGAAETTEPNLADIQALLISIQKTTNSILKENNKLSNEVGELKSLFNRLETELLTTKTTLIKVQNTNKELRVELDAAKRKISQQREEIDGLQDGIDDLEQYSRKNSLEIVGVPGSIRDNEGAVLKIARVLNVDMKPEDIDICHRILLTWLSSWHFTAGNHWCQVFMKRNGLLLRQKTTLAQQLPEDYEEKIVQQEQANELVIHECLKDVAAVQYKTSDIDVKVDSSSDDGASNSTAAFSGMSSFPMLTKLNAIDMFVSIFVSRVIHAVVFLKRYCSQTPRKTDEVHRKIADKWLKGSVWQTYISEMSEISDDTMNDAMDDIEE